MTGGGRAQIFGRDPDAYDAARPDYPREAIDHLVSLSPGTRAVEIGAGTGKATVEMARRGLEIICLEPSAEMAAVLRSKNLAGVKVVESRFEDWVPVEGGTDLIYAAQAWHWVERLGPGGALALMWNLPQRRFTEFPGVYARYAPGIDTKDERTERRDSHDWLSDMKGAGFVEPWLFTHSWSVELSSASYRALYSTYSDHIMLEPEVRIPLLDALEAAVDERGGHVTVDYVTKVFSGKAPG